MSSKNLQDPINDQTCPLCQTPSDDNMVKCYKCNNTFHQKCVGVPNEKNYKCRQCQSRPSHSSKSATSHGSVRSRYSHSTRIELQLQKLEEERKLNQKRLEEEIALNRRYLQQKYQLLEEQADIGCDETSQRSQSVRNWLEKIPGVRTEPEDRII